MYVQQLSREVRDADLRSSHPSTDHIATSAGDIKRLHTLLRSSQPARTRINLHLTFLLPWRVFPLSLKQVERQWLQPGLQATATQALMSKPRHLHHRTGKASHLRLPVMY